jgi:hypothetical protein
MPCDVEADQARADFNKLREAATASLDAAASAWSDVCVARGKQQEANSKTEELTAAGAASPSEHTARPTPRRKPRRKRSVA